MKHEMKLNPNAFEGVRNHKQKYESRLFDEKRRRIKIGDTIVFSKLPELKETVEVKVIDIINAKNFEELFHKVDPVEANWPATFSAKDCAKAMLKFYPIEEQEQYEVAAFKLELV